MLESQNSWLYFETLSHIMYAPKPCTPQWAPHPTKNLKLRRLLLRFFTLFSNQFHLYKMQYFFIAYIQNIYTGIAISDNTKKYKTYFFTFVGTIQYSYKNFSVKLSKDNEIWDPCSFCYLKCPLKYKFHTVIWIKMWQR